jgi:hypothetical protein
MSYWTVFSGLDTCVCKILVEALTLLSSFVYFFGNVWLRFFSYTLFTLCPFETKRGSILCFGQEIYFKIGQVFFVPEWPNGEFVSILCWLHSG